MGETIEDRINRINQLKIAFLAEFKAKIWTREWEGEGIRTISGLPDGIATMRGYLPENSEDFKKNPTEIFGQVLLILSLKDCSSSFRWLPLDPTSQTRYETTYNGWGLRKNKTQLFYNEQSKLAKLTQEQAEIIQNGEILSFYQNNAIFLDYQQQTAFSEYMGKLPMMDSYYKQPLKSITAKSTRYARVTSEGFTNCRAVLIHELNSERYWFFHIDPNVTDHNHFSYQDSIGKECLLKNRQIEIIVIVSKDSLSYVSNLTSDMEQNGNTIQSLKEIKMDYGLFDIHYNIESKCLKIGRGEFRELNNVFASDQQSSANLSQPSLMVCDKLTPSCTIL